MPHRLNPLYFWLGILLVAGGPVILALRMHVDDAALYGLGALFAFLLGLAVLPPLARLLLDHVPWRGRKKRRAAPTCRGCGYDLRASPERCPECGAKVDPMDAALVRYYMSLQQGGEPTRFKLRRRRGGAPARG